MNRFSTFLAASALTLTSAVAAIAGEQFVDKTGFAVSGYAGRFGTGRPKWAL
jgi:hypothetical protein